MEIKAKKCKGQNKAKNHKGCSKMVFKRVYGLCGVCYRDWLLNTKEGQEKIKQSTLRATKIVAKEKKQKEYHKKKEWRAKNKSIQKLIQEARVVFQKYIRQRDQKKPCISCGNFYADIYDAGHYFKAELYTGLIFDERNVHKQCRACNSFLHGNEAKYRIGLFNRYGTEFTRNLENDAISKRYYKFTREEIIKIKKKYQKLNNENKNNNTKRN